MDYCTYGHMIDNVVLIVTGTLHERDVPCETSTYALIARQPSQYLAAVMSSSIEDPGANPAYVTAGIVQRGSEMSQTLPDGCRACC